MRYLSSSEKFCLNRKILAGCTEFCTETGMRSLVSVQKFVHPAACLPSLKREQTLVVHLTPSTLYIYFLWSDYKCATKAVHKTEFFGNGFLFSDRNFQKVPEEATFERLFLSGFTVSFL